MPHVKVTKSCEDCMGLMREVSPQKLKCDGLQKNRQYHQGVPCLEAQIHRESTASPVVSPSPGRTGIPAFLLGSRLPKLH